MADRKLYSDGDYEFINVKSCLYDDFSSEKDFCDYIENHIKEFCKDCLGVEYKSHTREEQLVKHNRSIRGNRRIDFVITTTTNERIGVEAKRPTFISELSAAVGQALGYIAMFEVNGNPLDRIVILSTKIDSTLPIIISRFNLPIGFICFDKDKFLTYKGENERK